MLFLHPLFRHSQSSELSLLAHFHFHFRSASVSAALEANVARLRRFEWDVNGGGVLAWVWVGVTPPPKNPLRNPESAIIIVLPAAVYCVASH